MFRGKKSGGFSSFGSTVLSVFVVYLLLKLAFPYFSMVVTGKEHPLPIPAVAMVIYMFLAVMGAYLYVTASQERLQAFLRPVWAFLRGEGMGAKPGKARTAVLVALPLFVGGVLYQRAVPRVQSPTGVRIQHPTMPGRFEKLQNPFRHPSDAQVRQFIQEANLGNVPLEKARKALVRKYTEEGIVLYEKNCRPCHGVAAGGDGPMARAFRLKPANFRDPGTIATVVESFPLWRITEGGPGLPNEATPWDSAMPIWKENLTQEEMWKIILAEYDIGGVEPRKPEKLGSSE